MGSWGKAIMNGIVATIAMELFYRATDAVVHHGINVPYANGAMFHFSSLVLIYLAGYLVDFFGGSVFSLLYRRFVRAKSYGSGILYAVFFVWLIVDGLIFEPMGSAGILMLGAGMKAFLINLFAHAVYGVVLGLMYSTASRSSRVPTAM